MAASDPAPLDVLTVGDGNFSFSLAYLRKHGASIRLVATSYDAYDELVAKYPESARLCAQLTELGATVLDRVDATNLDVSLRNAIGDDKPLAFDRVIFNHPHCGEENVARHQSLLSHFYVSAQRVLRRDGGRIHLTLAEGQPERWEAQARAVRAGLCVVQEVHDVDADAEHAVAYERKRHQNGRSFHRVLLHGERKEQASTLFVLAVAEATPTETAASTTTTRKRKAPEAMEEALPFACEPCGKGFKTAQGLKTHVHMVHELGVAGAATEKPELPCGHCDRTFRNEEARRQHEISKHGDDASIRPDWFRPLASTKPSGDQTTSKTCAICGLTFADDRGFDDHWQELQPKAVIRRECSLCGKSFEEERALRQHRNFCRAKAVEPEETTLASR